MHMCLILLSKFCANPRVCIWKLRLSFEVSEFNDTRGSCVR